MGYWIIPPILLILILRRIDFPLFYQNLTKVNGWLLILAVGSYFPALVIIAAVRWKITLSEYFHHSPPLGYLVRHYWIGMALGFFSPGQIGLDAYRVVVIGKRCHKYMQMIFAILVEKTMALLNAVLLVFCLYPLIKQYIVHQNPVLNQVVSGSFFIGTVSIGMGGLIFIAARQRLAHQLANKISTIILRFIDRVKGKVETDTAAKEAGDVSKILNLLGNPRPFILVFIASLAIQVVSAVGNQIIFQAVGYDIPFLVNLFVTPIFYFIFLLPISFGSLGVREGAYILLYGIFGVSPEIALLVSFINLSGILLNNAIGAAMIWGGHKNKLTAP